VKAPRKALERSPEKAVAVRKKKGELYSGLKEDLEAFASRKRGRDQCWGFFGSARSQEAEKNCSSYGRRRERSFVEKEGGEHRSSLSKNNNEGGGGEEKEIPDRQGVKEGSLNSSSRKDTQLLSVRREKGCAQEE